MSNKLFASNSHIDSLVKYVLDVKPYHTKLSEIVEEYIFQDSFRVGFSDSYRTLTVLGPDYKANSTNPNLNIWASAPIRPLSNMSADRSLQGDGRLRFKIPPSVTNKLLSASQQERVVITSSLVQAEDGQLVLSEISDQVLTENTAASQIIGLPYGVFSQRDFVGPGIPRVLLDGVGQAEGSDYHISLGAYSFATLGTTWKSSNTPTLAEGATHKNTFPYNEGALAYANIKDPLVTIKNIASATYEEWTLVWDAESNTLSVSGSLSGPIGSATFDAVFIHEKLTFNFGPTVGVYTGGAVPLAINQKFTLTPRAKITVAPDAPDEIWTLIKTNPQATSNMLFTGTATNAVLNVFAQSVYDTPESTWTVTFTSPTTYTVSSSLGAPTYPVTHNMVGGPSYKDAHMHFSVSSDNGFTAGDKFEFNINGDKPNYLVFGSVSGWQPSAFIGEWYWNGKIGFKIPQLEYFAYVHSASGAGNNINALAQVFTPGKQIHPSAAPSVYQVKFRKNVSSAAVSTATVLNNIYGYKRGLKLGSVWEDEFSQFTIDNSEFIIGDQIDVFIAHAGFFRTPSSDELLYPLGKHEEYFPLYHSYGCVIIPAVTSINDVVIIDKVERELVQFKIGNSLSLLPVSLLPLAVSEESSWIPLEYRFNSVFPDYVSNVEAYLGSNPDVKVFEIHQPQASNGNPDSAILEFDAAFYNQFVVGREYTLRFNQSSSYQQKMRVKISEALRIFATLDLSALEDEIAVGNQLLVGYDEGAYDESPYDSNVTRTAIHENLTIVQSTGADIRMHGVYGPQHRGSAGLLFSTQASEYTVTYNENFEDVLIVTEAGSSFYVTPDLTPYSAIPTAVSTRSFSFSVPLGSAPFRVILTGGDGAPLTSPYMKSIGGILCTATASLSVSQNLSSVSSVICEASGELFVPVATLNAIHLEDNTNLLFDDNATIDLE